MTGTPGQEALNCTLYSVQNKPLSRSEHDEGLSNIAENVLLLNSDDIELDGL